MANFSWGPDDNQKLLDSAGTDCERAMVVRVGEARLSG